MQSGAAYTEAESAFATAEEVEHAIQQLTKVDYLRLVKAARLKMDGSSYATAYDLVNEAVQTPYLAALGQGGRRWPKHIDFMSYLMMTIRGLASDSRGSAKRRSTISHRVLVHDGAEERDIFDDPRFSTPSLEQTIMQEQHEEHSRETDDSLLATIDERFKEDTQVQWIIKGIKEAKGAREIQDLSGMSKTEYESAQRRWRRGVERLFTGRSKP